MGHLTVANETLKAPRPRRQTHFSVKKDDFQGCGSLRVPQVLTAQVIVVIQLPESPCTMSNLNRLVFTRANLD